MAQTTTQFGPPMVLIDSKTHKLAPDTVQVGPDGMPPAGYGWGTSYLNDDNWIVNASNGNPVAPVSGIGQPAAVTNPSNGFSPYSQTTFGGDTGGSLPDWMGGITQGPQAPVTQAPQPAVSYPNQPAGVTGGTLPDQKPKDTPKSSFLKDYLGSIITAGTGITGALLARSSNNKATDAQAEAADKALALTKEMYDQDRADMSPYRNIGAYSLGELGHLVGMAKDFGTQAVASATAPRTAIPRDGGTVPNAPSVSPWKALTDNNPATNTGQAIRELQSLRDLGATQQTASSFVRMRAPDGEEADVQPHEVPLFEAHGAMRI